MTGANKHEKEKKMKKKLFLVILGIVLALGCATPRPVVVSTPPPETCPLPSGYKLGPAIERAERTLMSCPNKLDQVFMALLEVGRHSPHKDNSVLIQDLLKRLVSRNKISETYSRNLYRKYLSYRFVSLPDVKVYNLKGEIHAIRKQLKEERALKKKGLVACCNDLEGYRKVEVEYARIVNFMDNLVLNEEYLKNTR